jgi:hypothetical protein
MSAQYESPFKTLAQASEQYSDNLELETPFLDTRFVAEAWEQRESTPSGAEREQQWASTIATPFITRYDGESPVNLEAQMVEQAITELFDRDFNEAVSNLAMEAAARAQHYGETVGEVSSHSAFTAGSEVQNMLAEWLAPLQASTERLFEQAGSAAMQQQFETMSESEFDTFFETYMPQPGVVQPEFEDFLKKAWGKLKRIAKSAVNVAAKGIGAVAKLAMPIGVLLKKLVRLVRPLLNRVIRFALGKLPPSLRPAATLLGKRLGILREAASNEVLEQEDEAATMPEAETITQSFDAGVATLLFARDENEGEMFLNEESQETLDETVASPLSELDAARERFVSDFARLQADENPEPVIQQFIPAILPLLRVGITVIGRQRVVNFLAGYLARLVKPYVGPAAATALSRALVSVGLRMITLEVQTESDPRIAARAVATTLEDTVRRINQFGFENFEGFGDNLEQQQMLETVASEAFFEATMAHFPQQLLDGGRLAEREMFFETSAEVGTWVAKPRPRYKKYTHIFEVTITPQIAAQIQTFGNQPLSAFLRSHDFRLPGKARVHLYEAIPGTLLSQIAMLERRTPGLGSGNVAAFSKIHPLTTRAAGLLLKEPGLGRDVAAGFLVSRNNVGVGQRFYYIETTQGHAVAPVGRAGRPSEVNVTIDLPSNQVRVSVFFSEADAQRIVATGPAASAMTAVRIAESLIGAVTASITQGGPGKHITFNREMQGQLEGEDFWQRIAGEAAKRVVKWLLEELAKALVKMIKAALVRYFNARLAEFGNATRNAADGVTVVLVFSHPGLQILRAALAGRVPGMADVRAAARKLQIPSASIVPGFVRR